MTARAGLQRVVRTAHSRKGKAFQKAFWVRGTGEAPKPHPATDRATFAETGLFNRGKIKAAQHGLALAAQVHNPTNAPRVAVKPTSVNPFSTAKHPNYVHGATGQPDVIRANRSSYKALIQYGEHLITRTDSKKFVTSANSIGAAVRNTQTWRGVTSNPAHAHYKSALFGGDTAAFAHGYAQYIAQRTNDKRALREMTKHGLSLSESDFARVAPRYEALLRRGKASFPRHAPQSV